MVGDALLNRFTAERIRLGGTIGEVPTYTEASWKEIPFHVESSSDEFGRRGDVYEYPLGNEIGYKDLGKKARRYKLEGYLLGTNQVQLTREMIRAAESPDPGYLNHPMMGWYQLVACVSLTVSADYRRDKKRTKLSFEFVEASPALGALEVGKTVEQVWDDGAKAVQYQQALQSTREAQAAAGGRGGQPGYGTVEALNFDTPSNIKMIEDINGVIAQQLNPAAVTGPNQEKILDAQDLLAGGEPFSLEVMGRPVALAAGRAGLARAPLVMSEATRITFNSMIAPSDYASSVIREFHADALDRLREINEFVVIRQEASESAQALITTIRLIILRDYAVAAARKRYETSRDAIRDLDFIMAAYDDEERLATERCDDVLVNLIYRARASAASALLTNAIRLPGIAEFPVDGVWPSVVCAWKLYADSRRHEQIERYNPSQSPFWMGRDLVAPAR